MFVILFASLLFGGMAYQANKPCDEQCFQERIAQTSKDNQEQRHERILNGIDLRSNRQ